MPRAVEDRRLTSFTQAEISQWVLPVETSIAGTEALLSRHTSICRLVHSTLRVELAI